MQGMSLPSVQIRTSYGIGRREAFIDCLSSGTSSSDLDIAVSAAQHQHAEPYLQAYMVSLDPTEVTITTDRKEIYLAYAQRCGTNMS